MNYNTNSTISKQLVELEISSRQEMLSLFDKVLQVLTKFDGKPITKRIETALKKEVSENISIKQKFNSFIIEYYFQNRSVNCQNNCAVYIKNSYEWFVYACCQSSYGDGILNGQNQLIYSQLKTQILKQKEYLQESILKIQNALANIENTFKEYEELKKKCQEFNNNLDMLYNKYIN